MSIKTRGIVFATFFGSCLIVGLLLASLTTENWIQSSAKRHNSTEAEGKINFGLFSGSKALNVAYGWRHHKIDILAVIRDEPDVINFWLWMGTTAGTAFALASSAVSAVASVLKSASASKKTGTLVVLFVSNLLSGLSQLCAFICWMLEFYQYLTHNILIQEDRENHWYSTGLANLGHSFFFIIAGILIVFTNLILLIVAVRLEKSERTRVFDPPTDENTKGAIMLY